MPKPNRLPPLSPLMRRTLEELGRYKAAALMMSGFVHQLRTPIHIIQSSAENLSGQNRFLPNFKPQAELIARSAQRLEAAVNSLLGYVKGEKRPLQAGSLHDVLNQLGDFLREECRKRKVTLDKKLVHKKTILMDAQLLQEALINLFMNALQAMPQGGTLTIKTEDLPSNKISLEVSDTGLGMDKAALKRIMTPFKTTKKEGLGLGLFFTQQILKRHRSALHIRSQKGKGTTIRMVFPAA